MTEVIGTFGVIADVQYGDVENGHNFAKTCTRYYRPALAMLQASCDAWLESLETAGAPKLIMNLADIIDQGNLGRDEHETALKTTMECFEPLAAKGVEIHHLIGNHELYNFGPADLLQRGFGCAREGRFFYAFDPYPGWRFIVLNSMENSVARPGCIFFTEPPANDPGYLAAREMLMANNSNMSGGEASWYAGVNWLQGLEPGVGQRFLPYNGALGSEQLEWLRVQLEKARDDDVRVIAFTHIPAHPDAAAPSDILWDYEAALDVLATTQRKNVPGPVVRAVFAGHHHLGGYHEDRGVFHVTFQAPLETDPSKHKECAADVVLTSAAIRINGRGAQFNLNIPL